jgi:hypothetical protein
MKISGEWFAQTLPTLSPESYISEYTISRIWLRSTRYNIHMCTQMFDGCVVCFKHLSIFNRLQSRGSSMFTNLCMSYMISYVYSYFQERQLHSLLHIRTPLPYTWGENTWSSYYMSTRAPIHS